MSKSVIEYPGNLIRGLFQQMSRDMQKGDSKTRAWILSEDFVLWCEAWNGMDLNAEVLRRHLLSQWAEPVKRQRHGGRQKKKPDGFVPPSQRT